jgi:hypothetical protein
MCCKLALVRRNHSVMILLYTLWHVVARRYSYYSLSTMRSEGHCRPCLRLTCSGSLSSVAWLFSCRIIRLWYVEYFFISSVTNEIWRSLRNVSFETYHRALVMECSTFDWNRWSTLVFEGLLHPQSWIPFVRIGYRMHLYTRILFSSESLDFRPRSQDVCCTFKFRFWRFVLICFCQVSFWSIYLTSLCSGICILLIVTGEQFVCSVVKFIWGDFVWFILIFHLTGHSYRRSRWYWSCWDASARSLFVARRAAFLQKLLL